MDRLVDNDTKDFRWRLSKSETRGLLEALFPDSVLFRTSHPITMSDVLNDLRDKKLYGMTKGAEEHWVGLPKSKGENMNMAEESMAMFLNSVLEAVENITGERTYRSSHSFLIIRQHMHDTTVLGNGMHEGLKKSSQDPVFNENRISSSVQMALVQIGETCSSSGR